MRYFKIITAIVAVSILLYALALPCLCMPEVSAKSAYLYSPQTERELYVKNPDLALPMASTTKIMTALVVLRTLPLDCRVTIDERACGVEGSSVYLTPGEVLTAEQLLYALMLRSANDAAAAFAYEISGSVEEFAVLMNECAKELGLEHTHFENPHGLDADTHYTSAHDLCVTAAHAMEYPVFRKIVSTMSYRMPGPDGSVRVVTNHNRLLRMYEGADGVKTGFTNRSGRCLVGSAERDGVCLISVTLDAPNDWNDHMTMLDYGFSMIENRMLCGAGEMEFSLPVISGKSSEIMCRNSEDVFAVLEKTEKPAKMLLEYNRPITAPVTRGEVLGTIRFECGGKTVAQTSLVAAESVKAVNTPGLFERLFKKIMK